MQRLLIILLLTVPLAAQDLFPRFSVTAARGNSTFETTARIDPEDAEGEGTEIGIERDLGLDDSREISRFAAQWRPFDRHEWSATYFHSTRTGFAQIDRNITFRNQIYPVNAIVNTKFDLDYLSVAYTYWARRSERGGLGLTLGLAKISMDASVSALRPGDVTVTVTQSAKTDAPIALGGLQGRIAFTRQWHGLASVATLPRVTIEDYTGRAITADARLEYRPVRWIGVGVAYNYFDLDVDVAQTSLTGSLNMNIRGPEGYVRLGF